MENKKENGKESLIREIYVSEETFSTLPKVGEIKVEKVQDMGFLPSGTEVTKHPAVEFEGEKYQAIYMGSTLPEVEWCLVEVK